jgi:hypothetical protein
VGPSGACCGDPPKADIEAAGCNEPAEAYLQRVQHTVRAFFLRNKLHDREAVAVRVHVLTYVCVLPEAIHTCVCVCEVNCLPLGCPIVHLLLLPGRLVAVDVAQGVDR